MREELCVLVAQACPTLCNAVDSRQARLSMEFFRQEYWSGLPFPSSGELSDPKIEPRSPALQADALTSEPPYIPIKLFLFLKINIYIHSHIFYCSCFISES